MELPIITGQVPLIIFEDTPLEISLDHLLVTDADNVYPSDFTLTVLEGQNYTLDGNTITPFMATTTSSRSDATMIVTSASFSECLG